MAPPAKDIEIAREERVGHRRIYQPSLPGKVQLVADVDDLEYTVVYDDLVVILGCEFTISQETLYLGSLYHDSIDVLPARMDDPQRFHLRLVSGETIDHYGDRG